MSGSSRRTFLKTAAATAAGVLLNQIPAHAAYDGKYRYTDTHCHLVDFTQNTDSLKSLLDVMDENGVDHIQTMGMSVIKKWDRVSPVRPEYYLDDDARTYYYSATDALVARSWLALPEGARKRVHPFLCGFNPTDRNAVNHVKRMLEWYPGVWQGIGEIFTRHDDLTALTPGETAVADHPALDAIFELAREQDMAMQFHSNLGNKRKQEPIYLAEFERAVANNPDNRIILAHAGVSRGFDIPNLTAELRRVMATYPNLWVDLSWVVFDEQIYKGKKVQRHWIELVKAHPDRFMIGTDKIGHWGDYAKDIRKYDVFLDALPEEVARKVARDNFLDHILPKRVRETL